MDWSEIFAVSPNELSTEKLELIKNNLSSVDSNELTADQLRGFFELSCFIIEKSINDDQNSPKRVDREAGRKKVTLTNEKDESYYIQTIQELNREIAEYVYNKKTSIETSGANTTTDTDLLESMANETKKDLLYKVHVKNKYIKRLLSENDSLKEEVNQQTEQILLLNVSLKQTAHKLNKAIADLTEQKQQNHMTVDDITDLHAKINSVREQMSRIEEDKQRYKNDVLYLGDEMQKKINQWNEVLKRKYSSLKINGGNDDDDETNKIDLSSKQRVVEANEFLRDEVMALSQHDDSRFEMNVLSQAINKRNHIISEMESLLIDLTMEISQSAVVINRIIKNLSQRETNFASNLEKLRNHLVKLLDRPNDDHEMSAISKNPQKQRTRSKEQSKRKHRRTHDGKKLTK